MKKMLRYGVFFLFISSSLFGQTVTNISAAYHDGQIFLTWTNIPNADTGYYYIYRNKVPITASNILTSNYIGRVPYNFGYDFRLSHSLITTPNRYLITNDDPFTVLTATQNLFVMNCTKANQNTYFAVRCDFGSPTPNYTIVAGANSTTTSVVQKIEPIRCYLQEIVDPPDESNDLMEVYIHYGGNTSVGTYPAMANEGCLPFHFGVVKSGPLGGNNQCFIKFHPGGGNFIANSINEEFENTWKISLDDWIPAYNSSAEGTNTRWLGYHDKLDVYSYSHDTPPPKNGVIKAYTLLRNEWELTWIQNKWPGSIDPTRLFLTGTSQGNGGVLLHCLVYPEKYAVGSLSNPKFNLNAPDDHNPECKYNEGISGRTNTRIIWGNEDSINLPTNLPIVEGDTAVYKIYDLVNMNYMYDLKQNKSFPFIYSTSGKNDGNTCWEEKPVFFNTVQETRVGGVYYWDLSGHGGGGDNAWPNIENEKLMRYSTTKSYPAFSNCGLDGDPGSAVNPNPPYYSGDDTASLHGNIDWEDSEIVDNVNSWQAKLFIYQAMLIDSTLWPVDFPKQAKTDVTIRRAQNFKGFPAGTQLCWYAIHKGDTIQSGTVTQKYVKGEAKPITVKKVKVYENGTTLKVALCNLRQTTGQVASVPKEDYAGFPNPFADQFTVSFYAPSKSEILVEVFDMTGRRIATEKLSYANEGIQNYQFDASQLDAGGYLVKVTSNADQHTFKLIKE